MLHQTAAMSAGQTSSTTTQPPLTATSLN